MAAQTLQPTYILDGLSSQEPQAGCVKLSTHVPTLNECKHHNLRPEDGPEADVEISPSKTHAVHHCYLSPFSLIEATVLVWYLPHDLYVLAQMI